jgi:hypothetical protein
MAKKTKTKAKKATAKKAKAKKKAGASRKAAGAKVPMHKVVHFVRMLHDRKRAAKFIAHVKEHGASVTVSPKAMKAVGSFLQAHNLAKAPMPGGVDLCPGGDPFKCPT